MFVIHNTLFIFCSQVLPHEIKTTSITILAVDGMDETDIQVHIQDNTMYKTAKVSGDVVYNDLFYHVDDDVLPDLICDQ